MGKSKRNRKLRYSCGHRGYCKTSELCPKCSRMENIASSSLKCSRNQKKKATEGGEMDSKHFPSRSTTDNLPSSLSTPGERAGLTSASSATVDNSVTTSSSNPNSLSPHLSSTCCTSAPTDVTSHATNTVPATREAETDANRHQPDVTDSQSSLSDAGDKSYDPNNDPNNCSSTNSCSSLSELSAVISSTNLQSDELFVTELKASELSNAEGISGNQPLKNSLSSNNGQNINDTATSSATGVCSSNSNKDNISSSIRLDEGCKNISPHQNKKSLPATDLLPSGSTVVKDAKSSIADASHQSVSPRGTKRTHAEIESASESSNSPKPSPQKNKKRCYVCSCKLELAQRTIGKCRCDHVFCPAHRLPELHDCVFNHKEDGRREAREKMVKPTRHMGTSFRRDEQT